MVDALIGDSALAILGLIALLSLRDMVLGPVAYRLRKRRLQRSL